MKDQWIETSSGMRFSLETPLLESVCIEDIANSLAKTCRYVGHCDRFYSVAEHCVWCANLAKHEGLSVDRQMACLMHDAAEAYIGDISGPMKALLLERGVMEVELLEDLVQLVILQGLGMDYLYAAGDDVKRIDKTMFAIEEAHMLPSRGDWLPADWPKPPKDLQPDKLGMGWHRARDAFLDKYRELRGQMS